MSEIYEALQKAQQEKKSSASSPPPRLLEDDQSSGLSVKKPSLLALAPAEEYQKMYSALRSASTEREIKTVLFLSSVHGEGVSSVCSQFAHSLVQGDGDKILLVDANLRRPMLHQLFGLERASGLVELLEGKTLLGEVVKRSGQPGLDVVTAGVPAEDIPRLLSSPRLKEALAEWRKEYSLVLFDSSPVLAYADALVLGRLLDGVILVVQAGKTRWEVIQRAQEILKNAKADVLGVVLNKRQYVIPKHIYKRL